MTNKIDFINGNTKKCLLTMTLPLIFAMFLNMAYNLVDSIWIGNLLGEKAYAALTNSTPIILLLTSIAMGATNGVSILLSQAIGSKDEVKKEKVISTSFFISIIFPLVTTILLEFLLPYILTALNTPSETFSMCKNYLSIYLIGYVFDYLFLYFTAVLRSFGDTVFQALAMLVATILNAILDPIFINILGFSGAAIATLISQIICLIFMICYIQKKKIFKLKIHEFNSADILPIIKLSIPSIIQQSIPAISTTFLTSLVSSYSIAAIAAYGITGKLETILFYPAMALNMVLTSIVGQCLGGNRLDRAKSYLKTSIFYGILLIAVLSIFVVYYSSSLSNLFVRSYPVSKIVSQYFFIVSFGYILNTMTNCYLGSLNGLGKPTKSMLLMIFYYIIVRMPLAYILSKYFFGLKGIWIAILVSHIFACIVSRETNYKYYKKYQPKLS